MVTTLIKAVTLTYYIIDIHIIIINRDNRDFRDHRDYRDAGTTTKSSIGFSFYLATTTKPHRPCCLSVVSFVSASLSSLKKSHAQAAESALLPTIPTIPRASSACGYPHNPHNPQSKPCLRLSPQSTCSKLFS